MAQINITSNNGEEVFSVDTPMMDETLVAVIASVCEVIVKASTTQTHKARVVK